MRQIGLAPAFVTVFFMTACWETPRPQKQVAPAPVRITQFYAAPANPPKGEKTLVCYGVENATEVQLDPAVEKVWPSISRCFDLVPAKEMTLTLTATRGAERVSQSTTIRPGAPAVKIIEVSINRIDVARGQTVTVCYKTKNAKTVTIEPGSWIEPHSPEAGCVAHHPQQTTTYTVTATGPGGDTDVEHVTARVK